MLRTDTDAADQAGAKGCVAERASDGGDRMGQGGRKLGLAGEHAADDAVLHENLKGLGNAGGEFAAIAAPGQVVSEVGAPPRK